ncbi:MAG: hypothetical protein PWP19_1007, partial [Thermococcaceae archaeon]|nr:hypothetical protein [Thermococcaceae archaeon]
LAEKYGGIALEDLTEIRNTIRYSAEMDMWGEASPEWAQGFKMRVWF